MSRHRHLRSKRQCYQFSLANASPTLVTRGMATRRQGMQSNQHVTKATQQALPPHQPPCVPCTTAEPSLLAEAC